MAGVIFKDNTKEILEAVPPALRRGLKAVGMTAEGHAKDITPVDTGRLRNSIGNIVDGDSVYIGSNVEYAPFVENGSIHNKAHHMLKKAATKHTDEYKSLIKQSMENA